MAQFLDYNKIIDQSMRGIVKKCLKFVEKKGGKLPGNHHFYITFDINFPGVKISKNLSKMHNDQMTIVMQHQFWDLDVRDEKFSIVLSAILVLLFATLSVLIVVEGPHIGMGAILFGVSAVFVGGPLLALNLGVTIYLLVKAATSKGKKRELLSPTTFSLIHATDFADRYERHLVPLLRAGYLVLCDRYIFTAYARDTVRGCPPDWVRRLYSFAALPDLTFFFKSNLEVSLQRILDGRPQLKYFEAGMDLRLSTDPYESFRIFQGRILEQYLAMSTEFNFLMIDANQRVEVQQTMVRELVDKRVRLEDFRRHDSHIVGATPKDHRNKWRQEEVGE